nr:hypothetical protein GCM10020092_081990 [Actinoplanes digitatis]
MGTSGQRSRTSKTNGTRRTFAAMTPGTATVSGVLVAKTRSALSEAAFAAARAMNSAKARSRRANDMLFEYGTENQCTCTPSSSVCRQPSARLPGVMSVVMTCTVCPRATSRRACS